MTIGHWTDNQLGVLDLKPLALVEGDQLDLLEGVLDVIQSVGLKRPHLLFLNHEFVQGLRAEFGHWTRAIHSFGKARVHEWQAAQELMMRIRDEDKVHALRHRQHLLHHRLTSLLVTTAVKHDSNIADAEDTTSGPVVHPI